MIIQRWCDLTAEERRECIIAIRAGAHGRVLVGIRTTTRPRGGIGVHYYIKEKS